MAVPLPFPLLILLKLAHTERLWCRTPANGEDTVTNCVRMKPRCTCYSDRTPLIKLCRVWTLLLEWWCLTGRLAVLHSDASVPFAVHTGRAGGFQLPHALTHSSCLLSTVAFGTMKSKPYSLYSWFKHLNSLGRSTPDHMAAAVAEKSLLIWWFPFNS